MQGVLVRANGAWLRSFERATLNSKRTEPNTHGDQSSCH